MAVKLDLIKNASATNTVNSFDLVRNAYISGITASNDYDYILQAFSAAGLPAVGDAHPSALPIAANTYCTRRTYKETGNRSTAIIELVYQRNILSAEGQTIYEFGTNLTSEENNFDANGMPISVGYKPAGGTLKKYYPRFPALRPQSVLRATRIEYGYINIAAASYVGCVNSAAWAGGKKLQWMCTSINMISQDGGRSYRTTYEFTFNPMAWVARCFYLDRDGNIADTIATHYADNANPYGTGVALDPTDKGWKIAKPYSELNFSSTFGNP